MDWNQVLDAGEVDGGIINVVVEIPAGSNNKIEWKRNLKVFTIDRVEPKIFAKPTNYGFIPQTLDEDGDELLDEAIAAVKDLGYYQADLVKRVMAAALNEHPDWVMENAARRAEEIMDAARSNAYHHAVEWLQQARAAYLASGQQAAWQAYRTRLMQLHARKYKLVGMLKQRDLA